MGKGLDYHTMHVTRIKSGGRFRFFDVLILREMAKTCRNNLPEFLQCGAVAVRANNIVACIDLNTLSGPRGGVRTEGLYFNARGIF